MRLLARLAIRFPLVDPIARVVHLRSLRDFFLAHSPASEHGRTL
jgi:hypothetical protein